jgi:hypothetical protein
LVGLHEELIHAHLILRYLLAAPSHVHVVEEELGRDEIIVVKIGLHSREGTNLGWVHVVGNKRKGPHAL